jgi:sugar lactone lactonase YvrE
MCSVIGTVNAGFNGDGRAAAATTLYWPQRMVFDRMGRLVFTDQNNHRVRRMSADGRIVTIAGDGIIGSAQSGVLATQTSLYHPSGLAFDPYNNLIVASYHSSQIVRITPADTLTIIAGTGEEGFNGDGIPAAEAKLALPRGVAVDGAANIYIADTGNNRIRKIDAVTGLISTVAGNDTAGFRDGPLDRALLNQPFSVTIDDDGFLIVADTGNNRIRKIDLRNNVISTIAGNGHGNYSGDGGLATAAALYEPEDAYRSPDGTLFIADTENHCIRKVDTSGTISTVAGIGQGSGTSPDLVVATSGRLDTPGGVVIDPQGSLWIADTYNQRIRRVRF